MEQDLEARIGEGKTILIIDDEVAILRVSGAALRRVGFTVLALPSVADVSTMYQDKHVDAVLLDFGEIREGTLGSLSTAHPHAKVGIISGYEAQDAPQHLRAMVDDRFLTKPFSVDALYGFVRSLLH